MSEAREPRMEKDPVVLMRRGLVGLRRSLAKFLESGLFLWDVRTGPEPESAGKPAHSRRCARHGRTAEVAKSRACGRVRGFTPAF